MFDIERNKLQKRWKKATRGISITTIKNAMNRATPGFDWTGCSKTILEEIYIGKAPIERAVITDDQRAKFHTELSRLLNQEAKAIAMKLEAMAKVNESFAKEI